MNNEEKVSLGIFSVAFISIGALIGGVVINTINKKQESKIESMWRDTTMMFKELLNSSNENNEKLKKEIKSLKEGA